MLSLSILFAKTVNHKIADCNLSLVYILPSSNPGKFQHRPVNGTCKKLQSKELQLQNFMTFQTQTVPRFTVWYLFTFHYAGIMCCQ